MAEITGSEVVLGKDTKTGVPVALDHEERRRGLYIIGKNGTGKSTLLENLIVKDIEQGIGVCVLDPHGDLIDAVLERVPTEKADAVILLDVADDAYPFGLNLFSVTDPTDQKLVDRTASHVMQVFEKLWGPSSPNPSWGPLLADLLSNTTYTLLANPGYTFAELPLLLMDERCRARLVANVTNPDVELFWEQEYPKNPNDQREYRASTLNKVRAFLSKRIVRNIVGQSPTTVDFREAMDRGKAILVRLALGEVGEDIVNLLGSVILGQLLNAALSRQELPPSQRRQFHVYADEYHRFATGFAVSLLTEGRKFGVGTTIAHQMRSQFKPNDPNRGATLNAANLVVFQVVGGEDADELAAQFDHTPPPPEATDEREKRTISPSPVNDLVYKGHDNPQVRELARNLLQPLILLIERSRDDEHIRVAGHNWTTKRILQHGLDYINEYFVDLMEGKIKPKSNEEIYPLYFIIRSLCVYIGLQEAPTYYSAEMSDSNGAAARSAIIYAQHFIDKEDGLLYLRGLFEAVSLAEMPFEWHAQSPATFKNLERFSQEEKMAYLEIAVEKSRQRVANAPKDWIDGIVKQFHPTPVNNPHDYPKQFQSKANYAAWCDAWLPWLFDIMRIGRALINEPIRVGTGQYEPVYGSPRTYADVHNEIASNLANLPRYTAVCKLSHGNTIVEHTIRTLAPERAKGTARVEAIRERSRAIYCRPREVVEQEIRARQQDCSDAILSRPPYGNHIPPLGTNDDEDDLREDTRRD